MNAVGIDVSKGKSMLAALRLFGEVAITPREYPHTGEGLSRMVSDILALGEDTRVVQSLLKANSTSSPKAISDGVDRTLP